MKEIPLRNRKGEVIAHTIVDDADFGWLNQWIWSLHSNGRVYRHVSKGGRSTMPLIHRVIVGATSPSIEVDHINGNPLDNRRENLRLCTRKENARNRRKSRNCSSRFKGVSWNQRSQKWHAYIYVGDRQRNLGKYDDENQAAQAYDKAARELHGDYAKPNFIDNSINPDL